MESKTAIADTAGSKLTDVKNEAPRSAPPGPIVRRALALPGALRPGDVITLQRSLGNRAASAALVGPRGRDRLWVSDPHDACEGEADRIAEAVTRIPDGPAMAIPVTPAPTSAMRQVEAGAAEGGVAASAAFTDRVQTRLGQGEPLPPDMREMFETQMGADFSAVRLHKDAEAGRLSREIGAEAFTVGTDIYFPAHQASTDTEARQLLAHELIHVIQQRAMTGAGTSPGLIQRRMLSWQNTDWEEAKDATLSKGGAGGAIKVSGGDDNKDKIWVKTQSPNNPPEGLEAVAFANIYNEMLKQNFQADPAVAPGARLIQQPDEGLAAKAKLQKIFKGVDTVQITKGIDIIDNVDKPGALVFQNVPGVNMKDYFDSITRPNEGEAPLDAIYKEQLRLFFRAENGWQIGQITLTDVFLGNFDRFFAFNPENIMIDKGSKIWLIDNVHSAQGLFALDMNNPLHDRVRNWKDQKAVQSIRAQDFDDFYERFFESFHGNLVGFFSSKMAQKESYVLVNIVALVKQDDFRRNFINGVKNALATLQGLDTSVVTAGLEGAEKQAVLQGFEARRSYLLGKTDRFDPSAVRGLSGNSGSSASSAATSSSTSPPSSTNEWNAASPSSTASTALTTPYTFLASPRGQTQQAMKPQAPFSAPPPSHPPPPVPSAVRGLSGNSGSSASSAAASSSMSLTSSTNEWYATPPLSSASAQPTAHYSSSLGTPGPAQQGLNPQALSSSSSTTTPSQQPQPNSSAPRSGPSQRPQAPPKSAKPKKRAPQASAPTPPPKDTKPKEKRTEQDEDD